MLERIIRAIAGTFILLSLVLAIYVHINWLWFTAFVGANLLQSNCFSCHSPNAAIQTQIAPTLSEIKTQYLHTSKDKTIFAHDLFTFIENPSSKTSKMPKAVEQYGMMPKMAFSKKDIQAVAEYLYHTSIENPSWFETHFENEQKKHKKKENLADFSPLERGQKIAMKTKGVLGKNLLTAINTKGTENTLAFCNEHAYPLTDSMSQALNVSIKRVSDQARNPKNIANESELAYIETFKEKLSKGEKMKPQVQSIGEKIVGYYPIMTNKMCMQCHGTPQKDIQLKTLEKINQLYPFDKAQGYMPNELRGIWVVEMEK